MKTRLLKKLRKEAIEHFHFSIAGTNRDTFVFIKSHGEIVHTIFHTGFGRDKATQYCNEKVREHVLQRVQQIKLK